MKKLRHRKRSPAEVVCQGEVSQLLRLQGGGGRGGFSIDLVFKCCLWGCPGSWMVQVYIWAHGEPLNQADSSSSTGGDMDSEGPALRVWLKVKVWRKGKGSKMHGEFWGGPSSAWCPGVLSSSAHSHKEIKRPCVGLKQKFDSGRDGLFLLTTLLGSIINIILGSVSPEQAWNEVSIKIKQKEEGLLGEEREREPGGWALGLRR